MKIDNHRTSIFKEDISIQVVNRFKKSFFYHKKLVLQLNNLRAPSLVISRTSNGTDRRRHLTSVHHDHDATGHPSGTNQLHYFYAPAYFRILF